MLLELHHWTYPALNETDTDDLIPYITYYPYWKERTGGESNGKEHPARPVAQRRVYADQVTL